jgi:hypothetical protein
MGIYDLWNHQFAALVCEGTDTALILDALNEQPRFVSALRTARDALLTVSDFNQPSADFWNRGGQGYQAYDAVNDVLKGTEE